MYICIYIYVFICIYIYMHMFAYVYVCLYMHVCVWVGEWLWAQDKGVLLLRGLTFIFRFLFFTGGPGRVQGRDFGAKSRDYFEKGRWCVVVGAWQPPEC